MDIVNWLGDLLNSILEMMRDGFDITNRWQGLVVALIAVFLMQRWGQLLVVTLGAAVAYVLVEHFWPIITAGAELRLPNVTEVSFWQRLGVVYLGLLIIIAIFFFVKSIFLGRRAGAKA